MKNTTLVFLALFSFLAVVYFSGCENTVTEVTGDDDEYLKNTAITVLYDNSDDPDNIFANDITAFDNGGAVPDFDGAGALTPGGYSSPIDSIVRHGRKLNINTLVTVATITNQGDSLKNINIKKTISGVYIIIGYVNGVLDSIIKPITLEKERFAVFKRVAHTPYPRRNWRLFRISAVDGQSTAPQVGTDNILLNKIEVYRNGILIETLLGPDFTQNIFSSRLFSGAGIMNFRHGDDVRLKVFLNSNQPEADLVAFHWGRRYPGFHRERLPMISETPNGSTWNRIFERTFHVGPAHRFGVFNGYISGTTFKSLFDTNTNIFSTTAAGAPYRMLP